MIGTCDEAQRPHRRSMLLHEQADEFAEGLAGLALADLLGLRVLAQPRPPAREPEDSFDRGIPRTRANEYRSGGAGLSGFMTT